MKHKVFKPFDKVLVRNDNNKQWYCAIYSHFSEPYHYISYHFQKNDEDILPYKGNEHLVGIIGEPEEEIQLEKGEVVVFCDSPDFLSRFTCMSRFGRIDSSSFITTLNSTWKYAIKFSDFNPENMEETKKHILCVRNGRIIRYKE